MYTMPGTTPTELHKMQEVNSADNQQSEYLQSQTDNIYTVNFFLAIIYYGLLMYFVYHTYGTFRYSSLYYKKLCMVILLFAYPFIIYPLQYSVYNVLMYIKNIMYTNIYKTNSW